MSWLNRRHVSISTKLQQVRAEQANISGMSSAEPPSDRARCPGEACPTALSTIHLARSNTQPKKKPCLPKFAVQIPPMLFATERWCLRQVGAGRATNAESDLLHVSRNQSCRVPVVLRDLYIAESRREGFLSGKVARAYCSGRLLRTEGLPTQSPGTPCNPFRLRKIGTGTAVAGDFTWLLSSKRFLPPRKGNAGHIHLSPSPGLPGLVFPPPLQTGE